MQVGIHDLAGLERQSLGESVAKALDEAALDLALVQHRADDSPSLVRAYSTPDRDLASLAVHSDLSGLRCVYVDAVRWTGLVAQNLVQVFFEHRGGLRQAIHPLPVDAEATSQNLDLARV